jgi:predicted RNA-binding protein Jag
VSDSQVALAIRPDDERRERAVALLEQMLRSMEVPATVSAKDLPDGTISIAVMPGVELQGVTPGRRSPLGDALQYLVNKLVNRPGLERRWVSIGIGSHPEPRAPKPPRAASPVSAPPPAPVAATPAPVVNGTVVAPAPRPAPASRPAPAARSADADERTLESPEDATFDAAALRLAQRAATTGRLYAVVAMPAEVRGRLLRAADGVAGLSARAEGEGRLRRVVLTPEKLVPMPRQRLPVDDDADEE